MRAVHLLQNLFFIMKDHDLRFPCILGLDFLASHQIWGDFGQRALSLPNADTPVTLSDRSPQAMVSLLLTVTPPTIEKDIRTLVEATDITDGQKPRVLEMLCNWPTLCHIYRVDEVPVSKRAYPVPVHKQQLVEEELRKMLDLRIIRPSTWPWAAPIVLVPKKGGETRLV